MELKDIIDAIISEIDMGKACQLRSDSYEGRCVCKFFSEKAMFIFHFFDGHTTLAIHRHNNYEKCCATFEYADPSFIDDVNDFINQNLMEK